MNTKLLNEINKIKKLSIIEQSSNSQLLDDLKSFFSTASQQLLQRDDVKKLKSFYDNLLSNNSKSEKVPAPNIDINNINDINFYEEVLKCLGAPVTKNNVLFMLAWRQAEGGLAKNNPFNTMWKRPNSTNFARGIQNYATKKDGIIATCSTLKQANFQKIKQGLIDDVGLKEMANILGNSPWGTDLKLITAVVNGYLAGKSPKPKKIVE
jgi:hypothetical protein